MNLDELLPPEDLQAAIEAGHASRKRHPELPLSIYTYTRVCQYDRVWTPVTVQCRGLVVDDETGQIVAKPFPKFFNVEEHDQGHDFAPPLPNEPFEVYDKVDGSLAIVFFYAGKWRVASKGSFISEQAQWAQKWLDSKDTGELYPQATYLAEIIYPDNRIVVDYGDREDLVLLATFWNNSGGGVVEVPLDSELAYAWRHVGSTVRRWPQMPLAKLLELTQSHTDGTEAEGYVIRFTSGVRAKAKFAEYVRLHKILTGVNERDIWRYLGIQKFAAGRDPKQVAHALGMSDVEVVRIGERPLDRLLEQVPDEFDAWVRKVRERLEYEGLQLAYEIDSAFSALKPLAGNRGDFARAVNSGGYPPAVRSALFMRLDGKDLILHVWRAIKPGPSVPFKSDEEG